MRAFLASLWLAPLTAGLLACGSAVTDHGSGTGSPRSAALEADGSTANGGTASDESLAAPVHGDSDGDSAESTAFDSDDFHSMHFGHAANPADRRQIGMIVRRYYDALAREDGLTVCSLLLEIVAETLAEKDNGRGPAAAGSCPDAVSQALSQSHPALVAEARTLRVIGVRVRRRRASAILTFAGRAARHILLYREEGAWKVGTLADEDLG